MFKRIKFKRINPFLFKRIKFENPLFGDYYKFFFHWSLFPVSLTGIVPMGPFIRAKAPMCSPISFPPIHTFEQNLHLYV